ncbi:MAG: HD domain-containing protein [Lewinellaceae bacterium]|nr:HD domain-containing protein [Lewinella sp.]MCB9278356.1 HD domain-containing protein [Lewinellaceae bacterium]
MSLTLEAAQFVEQRLTSRLTEDHRYHNWPHTMAVREACGFLGVQTGLSPDDLEVLDLAALFHDIGFIETYRGHEAVSREIAGDFLTSRDYPADKLEKVLACIDSTQPSADPSNQLEAIIKDADLSNLARTDYLSSLNNLRMEWELLCNEFYSDREWFKLNYKFLKAHQYYTDAAKSSYDEQLKINQKVLKKMSKGEQQKESGDVSRLASSKSAQMMFKTSLRNHLDLSNLADNKANIMLSINALIITIAMPLAVSYIKAQPYLLYPAVCLLATCLCSMIFATLATRPIRMSGYTELENIKAGRSNLFFFGNFYKMSYNEYQTGMQHVLEQEERLEDSVMRDLYFLGRSLGMKYSQLRICYNVFMSGVILSVLVFGIAYLLYD